jgi:hypothetical protein
MAEAKKLSYRERLRGVHPRGDQLQLRITGGDAGRPIAGIAPVAAPFFGTMPSA